MSLLQIWRVAGVKSGWHLLFLVVTGCVRWDSPEIKQPTVAISAQRPIEAVLPKSYAGYRSQLLSQIDYQVEIDLTKQDSYTGLVKIKFFLKEAKDLTIDFTNGAIDEIKVNGFSKAPDYNKYFLNLKKQDLSVGENLIEIRYMHSYGPDEGLIRFVDPVDKKVYIFSNFEKYRANQIWPCFDQSDLFSTVEIIVKTPKDWQVISSSPQSTADYSGGVFYWQLPRFQKINIQSFSLAAGFFRFWQKNVNTTHHTINLRLWARQSVAKQVPLDDWFFATKNGFVFLEKELDMAFPLGKYDQVLVPSQLKLLNGGFSSAFFEEKDFIFEKNNTYETNRNLTRLTLEKLSRWWVGQNIVPLALDDGWISQSFMEFMSYEAMTRGTLYADSDRMLLQKKFQGDPSLVEKVFFWRALRNNIINFNEHLRRFLQKFSQSTITTSQFFSFWRENSKNNFDHVFISEKNSRNHLMISYDCANKFSSSFNLKSDSGVVNFQYQKIKISAFRFDGPRIVEMKSTVVDFQPPDTKLKDLNGLDCSKLAFVLIDPQNQNYLRWKLDARSLLNLKEHQEKIEDENIRFYAKLLLQQSSSP